MRPLMMLSSVQSIDLRGFENYVIVKSKVLPNGSGLSDCDHHVFCCLVVCICLYSQYIEHADQGPGIFC